MQICLSLPWQRQEEDRLINFETEKLERLQLLVEAAQKSYISLDEGTYLYSMSRNRFRDLANEAKAVRNIGRRVLVNVKVLNQYIEDNYS